MNSTELRRNVILDLPRYRAAGRETAHLKTDLARSLLCLFTHLASLADSKQRDYGSANLTDFGPYGVLVRANDKLSRLKNMYANGHQAAVKTESTDDTWLDLCNYGAIGWLMSLGLWPVSSFIEVTPNVGVDLSSVPITVHENGQVSFGDEVAIRILQMIRQTWHNSAPDETASVGELWQFMECLVKDDQNRIKELENDLHDVNDELTELRQQVEELRTSRDKLIADNALQARKFAALSKTAIPASAALSPSTILLPDGATREEQMLRFGEVFYSLLTETRKKALGIIPSPLSDSLPMVGVDYRHHQMPVNVRCLGLGISNPDNNRPATVMVSFLHLDGGDYGPYIRCETLAHWLESYELPDYATLPANPQQ